MTTIYPIQYRCCDSSDHAQLSAFLDQNDAQQIVTQGDVVGGFHNGKMVSLIAYQCCDRQQADVKRTVRVSTTQLSRRYRTTSILYTGLKHTAATLAENGVQQIEILAPEQSRWLNQAYAAIATPIGTTRDAQDECCIVYHSSVASLQADLEKHNVKSQVYLPGHESMIAAMMQQGF